MKFPNDLFTIVRNAQAICEGGNKWNSNTVYEIQRLGKIVFQKGVDSRKDVLDFANLMIQAMDRKQAERDKSGLPHYLSDKYPNNEAIARAKDKLEQLEYYCKSVEKDITEIGRQEDIDRAVKTAVHLADFCMIIAMRVSLGLK